MAKNKIIIAAPIYPPDIGGPSFYASMLSETLKKRSMAVTVVTYGSLKRFPTGVRHFLYACKLLPHVFSADSILILDSFSVGLPAVFVSRLCGLKSVVRLGGDFLWEEYVERTQEPVLLSEFYTKTRNFTLKEKIIFSLTQYTLQHASALVFSTEWQKELTIPAYALDRKKIHVIENVYVKYDQRNIVPKERILFSPSRNRFLKNKNNLEKAFAILKERFSDPVLDLKTRSHAEVQSYLLESYCLVVPSLSEVSPNIVLEALSLGVPAIVTKDCGVYDRIRDIVVWVDPKDPQSIADGMQKLMDARTYSEYMAKMSQFSFTHTPDQIVSEFLNIIHRI